MYYVERALESLAVLAGFAVAGWAIQWVVDWLTR